MYVEREGNSRRIGHRRAQLIEAVGSHPSPNKVEKSASSKAGDYCTGAQSCTEPETRAH